MTDRERFDTPKWAITAGQTFQNLPGAIFREVEGVIAGSDSPAYLRARWHDVEDIISAESDEPVELPVADADPGASLATAILPRLKRKAVVFETGSQLPDIRNSVGMLARIAV
ncbi:MAG TPA: hypothetical protein VFK97_03340, partial [Candidatus Saccharimonadales bacterium]|nr:hypothetical protein [Candidatus Saccharimonadales bacterium]